jgi:hypothetical protein
MINESVLLDCLVALTNTCKAQFVMVAALGDEVSVLRESVRGLDPTFDEVIASKRESQLGEAARTTVGLLDKAIERLKADLIV